MPRVLGVDPGTKTFDIAVVEDGVVKAEKSLETSMIAKDPNVLIGAIKSFEIDYIAAPSGYGAPVTRGDEVIDPRRFAVEVLLLSTEDDIRRGVEAGEVGIWVYDALAKAVEYLVNNFGSRVIFLPGVIHLPTVPWYRKINKVDMGTVDKLAASFLATHTYARREGIDYDKVNIVVSELGFGYNAAMAIKNGKVVDGVGGTNASIGTLTAGALDLEVVAHVSSWERWDVFHGGIFYYANDYDLNEYAKAYEQGIEPLASLFKSFVEDVAKDIVRMLISTPKAEAVLLTGRHSRNKTLVSLLQEFIRDYEVRPVELLPGASFSKEAAQGYAAIGEGLTGGAFQELVKHMEIENACGTVVDYLIHERLKEFKQRVIKSYMETVKTPKMCK